MPREARLLLDGAYYHVLTRGNDKKNLFRKQKDYKYFLQVVRAYLKKFKVGIVHYCIMNNHVHLLVCSHKAADLPKFMQGILQVYAAHFRKQYNATGFVFQNRYKSFLIEKESYLLECGRYIGRNPLRAGVVAKLEDYPWSSYFFYAKGCPDDIITVDDPEYLARGKTPKARQEFYRRYLEEPRPYDGIIDKEFLI
ncbi:MAG: transposase [Candidatus Omnitrophica bacterium]|nr:transposase [Candidatus Omnitrophota bacterium]